MATPNEDLYVVTKVSPNLLVYATNEFTFTLGDDCVMKFDKVKTTLRIVPKTSRLPDNVVSSPVEVGSKSGAIVADVTSASSFAHQWLSPRQLKLTHSWSGVLAFILLADSSYAPVVVEPGEANSTIMVADSEFDYRLHESLKVVVYKIDGDMSKFLSGEVDTVSYSSQTGTVSFDNLFFGTSCVPMIVLNDGTMKRPASFDLLPNRVVVDAAEAGAAEAGGPGISKVIEYAFDDCFQTTLRRGVNDESVSWSGSKATITHHLGGVVDFIVDATVDYSTAESAAAAAPRFEAKALDGDRLLIDVKSDSLQVCTVKIFKVMG